MPQQTSFGHIFERKNTGSRFFRNQNFGGPLSITTPSYVISNVCPPLVPINMAKDLFSPSTIAPHTSKCEGALPIYGVDYEGCCSVGATCYYLEGSLWLKRAPQLMFLQAILLLTYEIYAVPMERVELQYSLTPKEGKI